MPNTQISEGPLAHNSMTFVAISDTHGKHRQLQLPKGDVLIHGGDFCHYGSTDDVRDFLDWYALQDFEYKILIGGNHDFLAYENPEEFLLSLPPGITYLRDSGTTINGIKIWGSPYVPDLVRWAFGERRGRAMRLHWDLIPQDTHVLITHTPPLDILDKTRSGNSIGCEALAVRLKTLQVKYHVFGHVHNGYGTVRIQDTLYMNASNIDSSLGLVNPPISFKVKA